MNVFMAFIFFLLSSFQPGGVKPYGLNTVVIDAGHGGHDPGCLGKKTKEKDVTLGIALKIGKFIEERYPDVKVVYSRDKDVFVELYERAEKANNAKADLFISIHCNSACYFDRKKSKEFCSSEIHGVESWVMGLHKSEANLEVAKRENEVILLEKDYTRQYDGFDPNSPEANIIFSLYQNIFLEQSLRMATYIQNEVKEKGRSPRGVKQAGFLVLYKTTMPSVLVETGFLSNSAEEKYLSSQKGQNEIALAVFNAFKSYKNSVETQKNENEKTDTQEVKKVVEPVKVDTAKKGEKESPAKEESGPAVKKEEKKEPKEKEVVKEKEAPANENDKVKNDKVYWGVQFYSSSRSLPAGHKIRNAFDQVREDLENGIYKYSTGMLEDKNVAIKLQENVREKGYKDAFLIAFLNDKKITVNQAYDYLRKK